MSLIDLKTAKAIVDKHGTLTQEDVDILVTFLLQNGFTLAKSYPKEVRIVCDWRDHQSNAISIFNARFKDPTTGRYVGYSKAMKRIYRSAKSETQVKVLTTSAIQKLDNADYSGCREDLNRLLTLLGGNINAL